MPLWYWWSLLVGVITVVDNFFIFVVIAPVVFELELLEDLLELMRRSRGTTYRIWVVVIVHGNVCACTSPLRASNLWGYCSTMNRSSSWDFPDRST
jgi:hypothetical protein